MKHIKPLILVILDGWGISAEKKGNAIAQAEIPTIEKLNHFYPHFYLKASGIAVGLPWKEPGNSEVGHLNLGAGKIIYQNLPRIDLAIKNKSFFKNKALLDAIDFAKKNNSCLHLMGLVSSGGVHSDIEHLYALLEMAKKNKVKNLFIHIFTDGRDASPKGGINFVENLEKKINDFGIGKITTIVGRYWAMDRNKNWDRTEKTYQCLTEGIGKKYNNPIKAIEESYKKNITDEFIEPIVIADNNSVEVRSQQNLLKSNFNKINHTGLINDNDAVIFFNFRNDRARQLTQAFVLKDFKGFKRKKFLKNLYFTTMTEYEKNLPVQVVLSPQKIDCPLACVLSKENKKQLHIAETEKYAHVTYFFNGGRENPFPGEDRVLIPSPSVSNYEETPGMSAHEITEKLIEEIKKDKYDFIIVNYANPDMIGHTGNFKAAVRAIEIIDQCLGQLVDAVLENNGGLIITADHGNAEEMIDPQTGEIMTEHTKNPVPIWYVNNEDKKENSQSKISQSKISTIGILSDIAPTILEIMKIKKPAEMTGKSLLKNFEKKEKKVLPNSVKDNKPKSILYRKIF
jgi:2,3-bisphosphoglycerate-independent phosphoglycerate mutase